MAGTVGTVELSNDETIGYRAREGGDVPVVLLHGNMITSIQWDRFFEEMDPRYSLYAIDMRGFGNSSYVEPIDTLGDFADDLRLFGEELELDPFHLVGWSLGGAVATAFAADNAEWVRKLVLLAPVGTRGLTFYEKDDAGEPTDEPITTREGVARDPVRSGVDEAQRTGDTAAIREMWDGFIFDNPPAAGRYETYLDAATTQRNQLDVSYAMIEFNLSDEHNGVAPGSGEASNVEAPILIIRGEDDSAISREMVTQTRDDIGPNAELVEFEGCGHAVFVDDPDRTLERIEGFLG